MAATERPDGLVRLARPVVPANPESLATTVSKAHVAHLARPDQTASADLPGQPAPLGRLAATETTAAMAEASPRSPATRSPTTGPSPTPMTPPTPSTGRAASR